MIEFNRTNIRTWSMLGQNGAFGVAALEIPSLDPQSIILTSDLTYFSGLERFKDRHADRFYNIGIAEQNLMGIAAGLAKEGFSVFAANYATFATTRACDQLRVCLGYMKQNIKVVGCTAGVSIGILGPTHMAVEDIAILRAIPNITIVSPADCTATVKATLALAKLEGPAYLRLTGGMNNPIVYSEDFDFQIGKANVLRRGTDVCLVATGSVVHHSLRAAQLLEDQGLSTAVIDMHTIKPLDEEVIKNQLNTKLLVTVEEHSINGGLGGAVAELLSSIPNARPVQLRLGLSDKFEKAGDYEYLIDKFGLTGSAIANSIKNRLQEIL
jgi:transketolase